MICIQRQLLQSDETKEQKMAGKSNKQRVKEEKYMQSFW
jgi:hypothetical protein